MRIISGLLKGKSINFVKNFNTRPLRDNVKESIFNILEHSNLIDIDIENSSILDLYSGVGSFGIECISRGAQKVTFVENNENTFKILKNNLTNLSISKKADTFYNTVENVLVKKKKIKFDIFFLDPPFKDKSFFINLSFIKKNKMYKKKNIIILHREKKTQELYDNYINIIRIKEYGRSKIIFGFF